MIYYEKYSLINVQVHEVKQVRCPGYWGVVVLGDEVRV